MKNPSKKNLRYSGLFISLILLILFFLIPLIIGKEINVFLLFFISILLLISIFFPFRLLKPYIYWIKLGDFLSIYNKKFIFIVFFYLLLTPFGLIVRFFRYFDKLKKKKSNYKVVNEENDNFIDQY
tara:strand:- start:497 stop:874 length:378 start_codon:yes stop_codon:yes gene_type:complete